MEPKIKNCYALYFSDFSQKVENKHLTFSEKSVEAAKYWQVLEETERNKYRAQCENDFASTTKTNKENKIQHLCSICGRTFQAAFRLRYHRKTCEIVDLECPICHKPFKTTEGLKKHNRFVHNKERLHPCPNCFKQFVCRADLKAHFNIHEGVRFKCIYCEATFSNMSNKKKHIKKFH